MIIPCYNEAERIELKYFYDFVECRPEIDFCFVNDGSSDRTSEVLQEAVSRYPDRLLLLDNADNRGKAEAVRSGMLHVESLHRYEMIGFLDADLATPLEDIDLLRGELQYFPEVLLAMGIRLKRLGASIERKPYRHYMGRVFATVVSLLFRLPVYDTQCGAKLFRREVVPLAFSDSFRSPWLFDVEFLLRIRNRYPDYKQLIHEVPLNTWTEKGDSRIRLSHLLKIPGELYSIYARYEKK